VRCDSERSQQQNKKIAFEILFSRIDDLKKKQQSEKINKIKKGHHKSGNRSEKVKSYSTKRDEVINHETNQRTKLSDWRKGKI